MISNPDRLGVDFLSILCHTKSMKNTHLEHPEDSILTGDLSVLDWFSQESTISVKIDGAPAIVWGTDPATGTFFVGTKSVFNKKKIKINHSHAEIDTNHTGTVADILHCAFDCLPRVDSIIQGDFIGFGGSDTYRPNTITYKFPEVITQDFIVAPHTLYSATSDLRDAVAQFSCPQFASTNRVYFMYPDCTLDRPSVSLKYAVEQVKVLSFATEFLTPKCAAEVKIAINKYIRDGQYPDFDAIESTYNVDHNLMFLWENVVRLKYIMFSLINIHDDIDTEIDGKESDHEGYVISNAKGTFKLVNRQEFSVANFNLSKNW